MVATVKNAPSTTPVSISSGLELRADHKGLTKTLAVMARIADHKSSMPMLANVAIKVGYGGCTLVATDLNMWLTRTASWSGEAGDFTVPAKQLADIVKSAPGPDVKLTRSGASGLRIESGGVDTTLLGLPGRDFPKIPSPEGLTFHPIDGKAFAAMIESVLFSVCLDETRFHLNGVYLETDGNTMRAVSTDGHRLSLAQTNAGTEFRTGGTIVPAKGARELVRLLKADKDARVTVASKAPYLFVRCDTWEMAIKTIDAQFPPYWQVVPQSHRKLVTVDRKPLLAALKRAAKMCSETRGVRLDALDGKLTLTSDHPEKGTATESIACETSHQIKIGLNAKYLLEALDEIEGDRVTLALGGELDPVLVRDTEHAVCHAVKQSPYLGVIMPMRI